MVAKTNRALIAGGLVILIFVGVGVFLWMQARSARGLQIEIQTPEEVSVGVPFDMQVNVTNSSDSVLQSVRLAVTLPEDMVFIGEPVDRAVLHEDLGNIGSGSIAQEVFRVMVFRGESRITRVQTEVSYSPSSLGARFEKTETADIVVGESGLRLDITAPTKVFSGEDFNAEIKYENISDDDYDDLRLIIDYPPTFTFVSATLAPDTDSREWQLGGLRRGSDHTFTLTGNLVGPDDASFEMRVRVEGRFLGRYYEVASKSATVAIAPSPLSLRIHLNESADYIAKPGDFLAYTLTYSNNTDTALRDVVIRAQLLGEMFDFATLNTRATFRSTDNTLIWNAANTSELRIIPVGASGAVNFQVQARRDYPIRRLSDKNFTLRVNGEIESPTVPFFVAAERTLGIARLTTPVQGQVEIDARAFFRDAASGILNGGPFPPRVNRETQYTVHWVITNYATDLENVEVRASLGPNVRMGEVVKVNSGTTTPTYNERTQEVTWTIPFIPATRGVISAPMEAVFQISAIPSSPGNYWPLIGETSIRGTDAFTGQVLQDTDFAITTALPDDVTIGSQAGVVQE